MYTRIHVKNTVLMVIVVVVVDTIHRNKGVIRMYIS